MDLRLDHVLGTFFSHVYVKLKLPPRDWISGSAPGISSGFGVNGLSSAIYCVDRASRGPNTDHYSSLMIRPHCSSQLDPLHKHLPTQWMNKCHGKRGFRGLHQSVAAMAQVLQTIFAHCDSTLGTWPRPQEFISFFQKSHPDPRNAQCTHRPL